MARGWIAGWLTNMMAHGRAGEPPSARAGARAQRRWLRAPLLVVIAVVALAAAFVLAAFVFRYNRRA